MTSEAGDGEDQAPEPESWWPLLVRPLLVLIASCCSAGGFSGRGLCNRHGQTATLLNFLIQPDELEETILIVSKS